MSALRDNGPWEAMIIDVDLPSMTARFRIPAGLPFASGMYELRWVRRPNAADLHRWDRNAEPPEYAE